jgi:hypothetical protein
VSPPAKDPIGGRPGVVLQGLLSVGLLLWIWPLSIQFGAALTSFLHGVNLVFHEAGHILLLPFGPLLTALSGSLTQIAIPLLCLVALARHGDRFGASVALWWTGESLLDLAPYIANARAGVDASGRRDGTRGGGP